jgi:hypothetical protein
MRPIQKIKEKKCISQMNLHKPYFIIVVRISEAMDFVNNTLYLEGMSSYLQERIKLFFAEVCG